MKTLYERLTEEELKKIDKGLENLPGLTNTALKGLKGNEFIGDLTISQALYISDLLFGSFGVNTSQFYKRFPVQTEGL